MDDEDDELENNNLSYWLYSQGCIPIKWTAPEILSGHFAELSSQSDVYVIV